jgi:7-cyano-7-deazaguanine reductase
MNEDLTLLGSATTEYPASPEEAILETFDNKFPERDYQVKFDCPEFTSVCPKTKQPDFAHIVIEYTPDLKCIESKALKLYLFSFRNTGMFHESIVNKILSDLVVTCDPRSMTVTGYMNARGGISIVAIASYDKRTARIHGQG